MTLEDSQLIMGILGISGGTAALCIPIISVAYQVLTLAVDEETRKKMATTITLGGIVGIMLLICVLLSLGSLVFHLTALNFLVYIIFLIFSLSILVMMYIFFILLGFQIQRRLFVPGPRNHTQGDSEEQRSSQ